MHVEHHDRGTMTRADRHFAHHEGVAWCRWCSCTARSMLRDILAPHEAIHAGGQRSQWMPGAPSIRADVKESPRYSTTTPRLRKVGNG